MFPYWVERTNPGKVNPHLAMSGEVICFSFSTKYEKIIDSKGKTLFKFFLTEFRKHKTELAMSR